MTELRSRKDSMTGVDIGIEYAHHEIHGGSNYMLKNFTDLATNAVIDVRVTTPDTTKWAHIIPTFETESEYTFSIYEDVAIVNPGAAVTPRNRNRNEADASVLVIDIIENATVVLADVDTNLGGSTDIYPGITGSGKKVGGGDRANDEIILLQDTIYCFRLVCISAGWVDFLINWYEHTNL